MLFFPGHYKPIQLLGFATFYATYSAFLYLFNLPLVIFLLGATQLQPLKNKCMLLLHTF